MTTAPLQAGESITIQLKWLHQFQFAGYYAAKAQGYFAQEGLNVTLKSRNPKTSPIDDVLEGRAEYGVADAGLVLSRMQGEPVVLLAQIYQHSPLTLIALQESGIRTPFDLVGKRVMSDILSHGNAPLLAMLNKTLGGLDKITQLPQNYRKEVLLEGSADVISGYLGGQPFWFKEREIAITTLDPRDYGIDFYGDNLFTSESELRDHPQRVKAVIHAVTRGWDYALQHPQEIVDLIISDYNEQQLSRDHLRYEAEVTEQMVLPQFITIGSYETTRYQKIGEIYTQLGLAENPQVDERFFYNATDAHIHFAAAEQQWLEAHPQVTFTGNPNRLPYETFDAQGNYSGIVADYLKLITAKSGLAFRTIPSSSWSHSLQLANAGQVQIISGDAADTVLNQKFRPVDPYNHNPVVIVMDSKHPFVEDLRSLAGKKIAILQNYGYTDNLYKTYPTLDFIKIESIQQGLTGVAEGRFDALLATMSLASYHLAEMGLHTLRVVGKTSVVMDLTLFISNEEPLLHAIISKSLKEISAKESHDILQQWQPNEYVEKTDYRLTIIISVIFILMIAALLIWNSRLKEAMRQRQITEAALQRSEERFTLAMLGGSDGIFDWNLLTNEIYYTPRWKNMLGYDDDELENSFTVWERLIDADDRQRSWEMLNDYINGKRDNFNIEFRMRHKGGHWVDILSRAWLVRNREGQATRVVGTHVDISNRKRYEKQLAAERNRAQNYLDIARVMLIALDDAAKVTLINVKGCEILGLPEAEILGKNWLEQFLLPENLAQVKYYYRELMAGNVQAVEDVENSIITAKGEKRLMSWHNSVIRDDQGKIIGILSSGEDITERKHAEEALLESEKLFKAITDSSPLAIYMSSGIEQRAAYINPTFVRLFGYTLDEVPSVAEWWPLAYPDVTYRNELMQEWQRRAADAIATHSTIEPMQAVVTCKDGSEKNILWGFVSVGDKNWAFGLDYTESEQARSKLLLAASVFTHSQNGIVITDARNVIIDCNPAFSRITGYSCEEVIGHTPKLLASGRQGRKFYTRMWNSLKENHFWHGEIWNRRKDGEFYAELLAISAVHDNTGKLQNYIGLFSDISHMKEHQAELEKIAHFDTLTGVPNRRLLADRLSQAVARAKRNGKLMAVCYLDLDGFKPVNDQYGHAVGDLLLIEITKRLSRVVRTEDTLARLGGDEFVILFVDLTRPDESHLFLNRVLEAVSTPVALENTEIQISASIGVTLYPDDDVDADTLLRHADMSMYIAKDAGKNRYHLFNSEQNRQLQTQRLYLQELRDALEREEFVLYYQPKVDLISGEVVGAEGLIRWQHPQKGLLPPGAFLPYLTDSDLEIAVGEWVVESVLQQIEAWQHSGLNFIVSANISAGQLLQERFSDQLQLMLKRHPDVDPGKLELEILETAALSDMDQAVAALGRCHQLGVHFSLDDFGTGYSSLSYFRNLPVKTLKIDQSFVRDMLADPGDMGIVESVVRLAQAFNREVIAEGVETLEHGSMLIHLGCHHVQGYGIARPMPAAQIPEWVAQWQSNAVWLTLEQRITNHEDIPLLIAAQSHRNWIDEIAKQLDHPNEKLSASLDATQCRFGRWYYGSGAASYGELPEFQAIAPVHKLVHSQAEELLRMLNRGEDAAAKRQLSEMYKTRDRLLGLLDTLIRHIGKATP
ncbi:MAG: EAL domain-containing protein [Gammaproteobacteria bacterium]|nr:EAL domain-containing protein [Gammaproteobacteria bacterium]